MEQTGEEMTSINFEESSISSNNNIFMDDHSTMAATASSSTAPDTSTTADKKLMMGKAPKRKNIRNTLPEQLGAQSLEEQKREQERQQRAMMFASRFYNQQQQQQQQQQFRPLLPYPQMPSFSSCYLSDKDRADLAAREAVWHDFKASQKSAGGDDVVVLSSDDEENDCKTKNVKKLRLKSEGADTGDDSDCVCLSSDGEEDVVAAASCSTTLDVPASSHVNDAFNIPDADGRVLINVGHAESEPDIFLPQHLVNVIKPHQIGGLRFMYDNVVESVQKFNSNGGFGCILAHSMGLGKTFQVVSFTDIVYRHTPLKRVLLIVPVNTLQNWLHEFELWLPKSSFQRDIPPRQFDVSVIADGCKTWGSRVAVINEWYKRSGVLIMGYEMFRMLTNKIGGVNLKKSKPGSNNGVNLTQGSTSDEGNIDSGIVAKALLDPGPDLVVCDEGHRIKNFQSHTSKALSTIRTKRRIVLTGYPLQNNLMEYWCMVNFVRPNYLGTRQEFAGVFERPIKNGQCVDSTEKDVKVMRFRVHVLTNLLKGFVQRRSHALLSTTLPGKCEYILFVRKSPIQHRLYRRFIVECTSDMREDLGNWNPLKTFAVCCKIWNHPDVLYKALKNHMDAVDGDLDLGANGRGSPTSMIGKEKSMSGYNDFSSVGNGGLFQYRAKKEVGKHIDYRWAEELFDNYVPGVVEHGMKMRLALAIVERSVRRNDKILLFSQSLLTLDAVETFLNKMTVPLSEERWKKNRNYFRLDGGTNSVERQRLIARFNNERGVHLFLISTRAGGLGINLVGANRVIVFDASFNPCHDAQAVCRVYRYGQKKPTFIYRLIADNSMEKTIFNRQLGKQGIADRVVDERLVDAALCRQDLYDLLQYNEEQDMITDDCKIEPDSLKDELLLEVCHENLGCLAKAPVVHESLMFDRGDQQLSEAEKREAKRGYEREKKLMKSNGNGSGIEWKRFQTDTRDKSYNFADDLRHQRNWAEIGPPAVRFAPVPMILKSATGSPQMAVNGGGAASQIPMPVPMWHQQMQYHPTPGGFGSRLLATNSFLAPNLNPTTTTTIPSNVHSPPELIELSDDEA